MKNKLRKITAISISYLPLNILRVAFYKLFFGYKIKSSKIGFGTVINVESAELTGCKIGNFNVFAGPIKVTIKNKAKISSKNLFECGDWVLQEKFKDANYEREIIIEENTLITHGHFFDLAGRFVLGKYSWVAGRNSEFWTHGAGVMERNVTIGSNCYVASAVRFSPGSGIGNNVLVALGSVVVKKIDGDNLLVGGVPAAIIKSDFNWKEKNFNP